MCRLVSNSWDCEVERVWPLWYVEHFSVVGVVLLNSADVLLGNAIRCSGRIQKYLYSIEDSIDQDNLVQNQKIKPEIKIDRSADKEYEYPLTPPATDSSSESRSHSPDSESKEADPAVIVGFEVPARTLDPTSLFRTSLKKKGQGHFLRRRQSKGKYAPLCQKAFGPKPSLRVSYRSLHQLTLLIHVLLFS